MATYVVRTIRIRAIWIVLLSLLTSLASGQTERTSITGTVTDSSKAALDNASVTIRNVATNVTNKTTTNSAGLYFITSLPPGTYELTVEKSGFRQAVVRSIPLTTGLAATQDLVLEVGTLLQTVQVTAAAVQLQAQSSDMSSVITTRAVAELPVLGRDPLSFAALTPGVIPTQGQQANAGTIGRVTTAQIGGGLAQQNAVLIDGAESRGTTESGNAYSVSVEAVSEFKLETASYDAEYGRAAGGVAILSTKSGTNTYHATAWEYIRNNHLNANSWQNNRNGIPIALFSAMCSAEILAVRSESLMSTTARTGHSSSSTMKGQGRRARIRFWIRFLRRENERAISPRRSTERGGRMLSTIQAPREQIPPTPRLTFEIRFRAISFR